MRPPSSDLSGTVVAPRREWIDVHYEPVFSPEACFHVEVHWLVASGQHVEMWLRHRSMNIVKRFAYSSVPTKFVQIPTVQPARTSDPFHLPLRVPVPPALRAVVEARLLSSENFALDRIPTGWRRQYLHRSGMAMVRVTSDSFVWVNNHLPTPTGNKGEERASSARDETLHAYHTFRNFCNVAVDARETVLAIVNRVATGKV